MTITLPPTLSLLSQFLLQSLHLLLVHRTNNGLTTEATVETITLISVEGPPFSLDTHSTDGLNHSGQALFHCGNNNNSTRVVKCSNHLSTILESWVRDLQWVCRIK